jgi:hypothetical protein
MTILSEPYFIFSLQRVDKNLPDSTAVFAAKFANVRAILAGASDATLTRELRCVTEYLARSKRPRSLRSAPCAMTGRRVERLRSLRRAPNEGFAALVVAIWAFRLRIWLSENGS